MSAGIQPELAPTPAEQWQTRLIEGGRVALAQQLFLAIECRRHEGLDDTAILDQVRERVSAVIELAAL